MQYNINNLHCIFFHQALRREVDTIDKYLGILQRQLSELLRGRSERNFEWACRAVTLFEKVLDTKDLLLLKRRQITQWGDQARKG